MALKQWCSFLLPSVALHPGICFPQTTGLTWHPSALQGLSWLISVPAAHMQDCLNSLEFIISISNDRYHPKVPWAFLPKGQVEKHSFLHILSPLPSTRPNYFCFVCQCFHQWCTAESTIYLGDNFELAADMINEARLKLTFPHVTNISQVMYNSPCYSTH
jgi:hypothetical protein